MNGIPVSPTEREQILSLFAQGFPVWRIARRLLRHRWTIAKHLTAAGLKTRRVLTPEERRAARREWARDRRALLTGAGLCISSGAHGKATSGVLCERCREMHRRTQH